MRPIAEIRADIAQMVGDDYPLLYLLVELENAAVEQALTDTQERLNSLVPPASIVNAAYSAWIRHRDVMNVVIDEKIAEYEL